MSCNEAAGRRSGRGEELRRLEYYELAKRDESKTLSTFVPDPISISGYNRHLSLSNRNQNRKESKLGIYKTCHGKIRVVHECPHHYRGVRSLNFSNDGDVVVLGYYSGDIKVLKTFDGSLCKEFPVKNNEVGPVTCIRSNRKQSNNERFFVSCADGSIKVFSLTENAKIWDFIMEKGNAILSIDINNTGETLVSGGRDAKIRLYDTETSKLKTIYERKNINDDPEEKTAAFHGMRVFVVKYHPENFNLFVSGGWESLVKIWDIRSPTGCVHTILGPHICGETVDVKKNTLLTGSFMPNEGLQIWDLRTGSRIKACNPEHAMRVFEGQFISVAQFFHDEPLGDIIISANVGLKALDVISIKLNAVLHTYSSNAPVAAVQSHNSQIAFGDTEHNIYIGDFNMAGTF